MITGGFLFHGIFRVLGEVVRAILPRVASGNLDGVGLDVVRIVHPSSFDSLIVGVLDKLDGCL